MTPNDDPVRQAFEAHIRRTWKVPESYLDWALKLNEAGEYQDGRAADQWSGWSAALSTLPQAAAATYQWCEQCGEGVIQGICRAKPACAASKQAAAAAPLSDPLQPQDLADLERLDDLFSDGEGWDLPKERMQRLAELGVIRRTTRDHYSITSFGRYCLGRADFPFPLKTVEEFNRAAHAAMLSRNGITPPEGASE
jgi:hypothetical protein